MRHSRARPSLMHSSTARRFGTGSAPGSARHTGHVWLFGRPPKEFAQRQNIFVRVFSWTWISSPITGCHFSAPAPAEPAPALLRCAVEPTPQWLSISIPPGHRVEGEGLLERVADAEERVLGELRADQLQADGQTLREAAGDVQPRQPGHARRD